MIMKNVTKTDFRNQLSSDVEQFFKSGGRVKQLAPKVSKLEKEKTNFGMWGGNRFAVKEYRMPFVA